MSEGLKASVRVAAARPLPVQWQRRLRPGLSADSVLAGVNNYYRPMYFYYLSGTESLSAAESGGSFCRTPSGPEPGGGASSLHRLISLDSPGGESEGTRQSRRHWPTGAWGACGPGVPGTSGPTGPRSPGLPGGTVSASGQWPVAAGGETSS